MKIKEGKAKLARSVESSKGEYPTSISCYRPAAYFQNKGTAFGRVSFKYVKD